MPQEVSVVEPRSYRSISLWEDVSPAQWNDWRWQIANRITTVEQLDEVINLTAEEKELKEMLE